MTSYLIHQKPLTPNKYSRPGKEILMGPESLRKVVKFLVIHWVQNPGTSARFNRNWFEMRKDGKHSYGSAEYIVDDQQIIQCIPDDEIAYHVGAGQFPSDRYTEYARNVFDAYPCAWSIGIELCHPTESGEFTTETLRRAAWLCAGLCIEHDIPPMTHIIRHYDVTGKRCPLYWFEYPDQLRAFQVRVSGIVDELSLVRGMV